jgi:hypothetical protein
MTIGKLTIPEIRPSHVYELLQPIRVEERETANRVRGRIETIIAKNVDVDDTDFRNPFGHPFDITVAPASRAPSATAFAIVSIWP